MMFCTEGGVSEKKLDLQEAKFLLVAMGEVLTMGHSLQDSIRQHETYDTTSCNGLQVQNSTLSTDD